MQANLLNITGVNKRFGGLQALTDVGMQHCQGQIYGLIGPNGAGKTTFFNVHHRAVPAGRAAASSWTASRIRRRRRMRWPRPGIARTFQNIRLFGEMTALENVMVGPPRAHAARACSARCCATRAAREEEAAIRARAQELLDFVGIGGFARRTARHSCRTATSAGSRSPARWRPTRSCWRWTSRRPA